jgi:hypothetical protein
MAVSPYLSGTKTATAMIRFFRAHKQVTSRVLTFSLVAFCAFWLTPIGVKWVLSVSYSSSPSS